MYSSTVFALTQTIAEMPYSVLCATVFFVLLYYTVGLPAESSRAGYTFALVLITEIYSVTLGQLVAAITPTVSCTR
jgi:ABC-type multidrug transport system permease subunit